MKIYTVTFMPRAGRRDGGWHSSRPSFTIVAETKEKAIEKVLIENPQYKTGWDSWCSEFKIKGYIIEVYDEKTYNRDKNLESLDI